MQKTKKLRSKKYIDFVKSLNCVISGQAAQAPHHLIGRGQGGMGTKSSDLFAFPLVNHYHVGDQGIHKIGYSEWESIYGSQWLYVVSTLKRAITSNIITIDQVRAEIEAQVVNMDDLAYLLEKLEDF